jgi:hypothetical protein
MLDRVKESMFGTVHLMSQHMCSIDELGTVRSVDSEILIVETLRKVAGIVSDVHWTPSMGRPATGIAAARARTASAVLSAPLEKRQCAKLCK